MGDVSWFPGIFGGVTGAVLGEVSQQRRIRRALTPAAASRWSDLGFVGRWRLKRELQRGRTFGNRWDAAAAAEIAAAIRAEFERTWQLVVIVLLGLVFIGLGAVWIADREPLLGALVAAGGVFVAGTPLGHRRRQRRLAKAEAANRDVAERAPV